MPSSTTDVQDALVKIDTSFVKPVCPPFDCGDYAITCTDPLLFLEQKNWIITTIYFVLFSCIGFAYIASLRFQLQKRAHGSDLNLDKRYSLYVYALPLLGYILLRIVAASRGLAKYKCDMCVFGLVSGLAIALYKKPQTRAIKLFVNYGTNSQQKLLLWVSSAQEPLERVQEQIAAALDVLKASRVCFNTHVANQYARNLKRPLISLLSAEEDDEDLEEDVDVSINMLHRDFFGFPVMACTVSLQTEEAFEIEQGNNPSKKEDHQQHHPVSGGKHRPLLQTITGLFRRQSQIANGNATHSTTSDGHPPSPASSSASSTPKKMGMTERLSIGSRLMDEKIDSFVDVSPTTSPRDRQPASDSNQPPTPTSSSRRSAWSALSIRRPFLRKKPSSGATSAAPTTPTSASTGSNDVTSHLEAPTEEKKKRTVLHTMPKPRKEQVDAYVTAILSNPKFNIPDLPDAFEKKILTLAISMAMSMCLKALFTMNGKDVLGHHVELEIHSMAINTIPDMEQIVEKGAVEALVDELLKEKMINLTWLPDYIEKPLYVNVILAMMTVANSFVSAARFDFMGHTVEGKMRPSSKSDEKVATPGSPPQTLTISLESVKRGVERAVKKRNVDESIIEKKLDEHFLDAPPHWLPSSLERPIYKTVYALVLCVVEEVFKDLSISFLGDIVTLHLVPGPMPPPPSDGNPKRSAKAKSTVGQKPRGLGASIGDHRANHELIIAGIVGAIVSHFLFH